MFNLPNIKSEPYHEHPDPPLENAHQARLGEKEGFLPVRSDECMPPPGSDRPWKVQTTDHQDGGILTRLLLSSSDPVPKPSFLPSLWPTHLLTLPPKVLTFSSSLPEAAGDLSLKNQTDKQHSAART